MCLFVCYGFDVCFCGCDVLLLYLMFVFVIDVLVGVLFVGVELVGFVMLLGLCGDEMVFLWVCFDDDCLFVYMLFGS